MVRAVRTAAPCSFHCYLPFFGDASGSVTITASNITAVLSGIHDYSYNVQRATNVNFTLGVTNSPPVTAYYRLKCIP
ncbi:hypothetical protein Cflav_PD6183 [Pedosphaera parvula Ellin514]|uniref:Uncharacterized protein n=2 Tax=Pedosphaera TaxID=1032526 RepID=B9XHL5_PEDPL|nr:hypothetical protein Cflav_PD6183 [Pedosphaera parvula Ellin514]